MLLEKGDLVSHRLSGIPGRVTGFGPNRRWVRVKTSEGRSRNWRNDHLRVVEFASTTRPRIARITYKDGRVMTIPFKCGEFHKVADEVEGKSHLIESIELVGMLAEPVLITHAHCP